jgi:DNA-binding SARP family transcriptional activator
MEFAILGSLELIDGHDRYVIPAAKHRVLLALLLVNSNRTVPLSRLVDELWTRPPSSAMNLVRQYVSRLRRQLWQVSRQSVRLATRPGGYALLNDADCDFRIFDRLVDAGRDELRRGAAPAARRILFQALGLWRGDAFADVPCGPTLEAERARLEERRLVAAEMRIEAELAAGYVADAICELRSLTSRFPLREQLWAHLMQALWSTGCKGEALAVYQDARRTFAEELGLEPSDHLRRLEHEIITSDYQPRRAELPALAATA